MKYIDTFVEWEKSHSLLNFARCGGSGNGRIPGHGRSDGKSVQYGLGKDSSKFVQDGLGKDGGKFVQDGLGKDSRQSVQYGLGKDGGKFVQDGGANGLTGQGESGFAFWNYLRRDILMSFIDYSEGKKSNFKQNLENPDSGVSILDKIRNGFYLFGKTLATDKRDIDLLILCHPRRQEIAGKMVSIYTDFLYDEFPNSVTLERAGNRPRGAKLAPPYSPNLIYNHRLTLMSYVYRMFIKRFRKAEYRRIKDEIRSRLDLPLKDLEQRTGFRISIDLIAERGAALYFFYKIRKPAYSRLLRKIRPRAIVEVIGGSFDAKIINEAASELNIPTIGLQHGAGTGTINYPKGVEVPQCAAWYFTFSEYWKKRAHMAIPDSHIIATGYPYHDEEMKKFPPKPPAADGLYRVIFLTSPKYTKEFARIAEELIDAAGGQVRVIFKLHPKEMADWRKNIPNLDREGIEIIDDKNIPLYSLFAECVAQVGADSTAVYEGMSYELSTFIWDNPMSTSLMDLCESGAAVLFKDGADLAHKIAENRKVGRVLEEGKTEVGNGGTQEKLSQGAASRGYNAAYFWEPNAREKMVDEIKKIMAQNARIWE
ncbi:MAG: hypothetical protein J6P05_03590 [Lachnospiraceae bacterium]|nr:hypothetical protein [Lachnospiraceae bacterium]